VRTPFVPTIIVLFIVGAGLGYGALAGGPIIGILAAFVVILLLSRREQLGSYLAGFGLAGLAVLGHVILTCPAPSCHYDTTTPVGAAGFGVIAAAGFGLFGWSLARR
jgi:hypothetical protein